MRFASGIFLFALGIAGASSGEARLLGQTVEGTQRVCIYERGEESEAEDGRGKVKVGLGEPCPSREPAEEKASGSADATRIPPMATLGREEQAVGHKICYYDYLGKRYPRQIESARFCPMTPYFF